MNLPLVSIIVISYNHSKYIQQNLDSIKEQSYQNIELILADDASSDDSVKVFEKWAEQNHFSIKKNFHQQNTGLPTLLNECMDMVSGKYVKIIAADDFLYPKSLQKCVKVLEENSDVGVVFTDFDTVNENSNIILPYIDYSENKEIFDGNYVILSEILCRNRIIAPSVLMSTKLWKSTGKYDPRILLEDYDRWMRMGKKSKIYFIPEKLCAYRRHSHNLTQSGHIGLNVDDLYIKILYDDSGKLHHKINTRMAQIYITKFPLPKHIFQAYLKYPFRKKSIAMMMKYHFPPYFYEKYFKIRYRIR